MMRIRQVEYIFVEYIPDVLDDGILYVSIPFTTATHKCFCGCGSEVTTPIAPNAWELTYDGHHISLAPSIGSRNLKCKSHYWIRKNEVIWLLPMVAIAEREYDEPNTAEPDITNPGIAGRFLRWVKSIWRWRK